MEPRAPAKPDWRLDLPDRTVLLRSEQPGDAAFLAALFRANAATLPGIDPAVAESLMDMQYRSQSQSYRAAYPDAWFAVMTLAGEPFGRLILDQGSASHVVDYALAPSAEGQGLGTALLAAVLQRIGGPVSNVGMLPRGVTAKSLQTILWQHAGAARARGSLNREAA